MRKAVIIVENFYAAPDAVRAYALAQKYYYPYQRNVDVAAGRARPSWMTTRFKSANYCPFKSSARLISRLEELTGDKIDMRHWRLDFPVDAEGKAATIRRAVDRSCLWNCCFHLKPQTHQELGEGVHNHVVDGWNSVGRDGWAGLIYFSLNAPPSGGLKLWRNRASGKQLDWMTPKDNWQLIDDLGNVYNRLLLCRGDIPHSGADGWGGNLADGRLYQTFFFKIRASAVTPALRMRRLTVSV